MKDTANTEQANREQLKAKAALIRKWCLISTTAAASGASHYLLIGGGSDHGVA